MQNTEDTHDDMEFEDNTSTANILSARLDSVRKQVHSKLQQCIVDVSVCNDTEALLCALNHATAAHASVCAVSQHRAARLPIQKKTPANTKLDKQLRLCSTEAERQPRRQILHKQSMDKLSSVKQLLVGPEAASQASQVTLSYCPTIETPAAEHDAIMQVAFFMDAGSLDVPYWVHSEEVTTVNV